MKRKETHDLVKRREGRRKIGVEMKVLEKEGMGAIHRGPTI